MTGSGQLTIGCPAYHFSREYLDFSVGKKYTYK
jgi:hypothetical protein